MQHSQILKGIDIGTSKITTIVGQYLTNEEKFNVVAISSTPALGFRKGQIIDLEKAAESILQSIESAERMAGFQINNATISFAAPHIQSLNSQGVVAISNSNGDIQNSDITRCIEAAKAVSLPAGKEIIHVIPRLFTVDGQEGVTDPTGMNGVRLEVDSHLILASSPALKNLKKVFHNIGLHVDSLVYSGLVTSLACLTDTEKELGTALIDIGGSVTTVTVFSQNSPVYSAVIPVGSDNITNDLAIGLRFSIQDAQKIKLNLKNALKNHQFEDEISVTDLGFSPEDKRKVSLQTAITGIVKPRLEEIFQLTLDQIDQSGFKNSIPAGVVLTGGGSIILDAKETCGQIISLPVRLATPPKVGGLVDNVLDSSQTSAIGLLMYIQQNPANPRPSSAKSKFSVGGFTSRIKKFLEPLLP